MYPSDVVREHVRKNMADSSGPSNPSRGKLPTHSMRKDRRRKRKKCLLAICAIWKNNPRGQGRSFVGTGSLVKDFYKDCDKKIHLITSREVISSKDISCSVSDSCQS